MEVITSKTKLIDPCLRLYHPAKLVDGRVAARVDFFEGELGQIAVGVGFEHAARQAAMFVVGRSTKILKSRLQLTL